MSERRKRAILVVGPESSGNRLMTRLLVAAGCLGDGAARQRWDTVPPSDEDPIVWLRSVPHGGVWPPLMTMVEELRLDDYTVRAVVLTRDWHSTIQSQVRVGHVRDADQAAAHLRRAYPWIFSHLASASVPFVLCSYEALCQRPHAVMRWLCEALGLTWPYGPQDPLPEAIDDGNAPYYAP